MPYPTHDFTLLRSGVCRCDLLAACFTGRDSVLHWVHICASCFLLDDRPVSFSPKWNYERYADSNPPTPDLHLHQSSTESEYGPMLDRIYSRMAEHCAGALPASIPQIAYAFQWSVPFPIIMMSPISTKGFRPPARVGRAERDQNISIITSS